MQQVYNKVHLSLLQIIYNIVTHFVASKSQGFKKLVIKSARAAIELPSDMPKWLLM
jgi:hypothetical protein